METKPYLIFGQNGSLYGVEALAVQEIFFLPELTPIAEAPLEFVGVVNLRGEILPVMDLNLRFGYHTQDYSLTDSVIVLAWQGCKIGLIVNQVREVKNLPAEAIKPQISYGRENHQSSTNFLAGVAQVETEIVMLIDLENLIRHSQPRINPLVSSSETSEATEESNEEIISNRFAENAKFLAAPPVFCPNATTEEKAIFQERANNLRRQDDPQEFTINKLPLAVVALNGEYFGLNLEVVREFTDIRRITPIPCTPEHIIGNMNLRGEIVTLIDIRTALKMPLPVAGVLSKAMVIKLADVVAGIVVDEVLDVMYLNQSEIAAVPAALHYSHDEFLRGTAPYREKMMSILDLHKMLTKGVLIVDEEI